MVYAIWLPLAVYSLNCSQVNVAFQLEKMEPISFATRLYWHIGDSSVNVNQVYLFYIVLSDSGFRKVPYCPKKIDLNWQIAAQHEIAHLTLPFRMKKSDIVYQNHIALMDHLHCTTNMLCVFVTLCSSKLWLWFTFL